MILDALFLLLAAQTPSPEFALRDVDGEIHVDAVGAIDPLELVRRIAAGSGREVLGEDLLAGRARLDVHLVDRTIENVLELAGYATKTHIEVGRRTVRITRERTLADIEELRLDAEAAWVSVVRDFPGHEAARVARVELGAAQERRGFEDAALTHYDAATRDDAQSTATERALQSAGNLLLRRGDWSEAMRRFSRLAQGSRDVRTQATARIAMSRALAEMGRGAEALALVDVVDLSYPPIDAQEAADRRLARARAHLSSGSAADALSELDARASSDPRLGGQVEDLGLRARALEELGAPLEAARAWLACASVASPSDRAEALLAAARLSAAGGDDIAVLFIERLARGGSRAAEVTRRADTARSRLGLGPDERDLEHLEKRWEERSRLSPREHAALASDLVTATARERGAEAAAAIARTALAEVPEAESRTIRSALAIAYETEGSWAAAARIWGGVAP